MDFTFVVVVIVDLVWVPFSDLFGSLLRGISCGQGIKTGFLHAKFESDH